ncbi:PREDICTED: uncharacterized protein LOC106124217 [Papilio xuthus]|uniref:Uncharacterized protein LOC106124217 n=1 Tax=Papilio xuthus TaxID=66420 RepID=A0AAJ6ZNB6_PAPXU|nr:PREDICTED: uncharacterized protein LOC106124217 [Papilio xuthus]
MFLKNDSQKIGSDQSFTQRDLTRYIESLIKHSYHQERTNTSTTNYGWLTGKPSLYSALSIQAALSPLQPMLNKMTPESCAFIFMKMDNYVTETTSVADIMEILKKLLEEQLSLQLIGQNIKVAKRRQKKNIKIQPSILYCDSKLFIIS